MRRHVIRAAVALTIIALPSLGMACACGCGIFDIQAGSNIPNGAGGTVWLDYDFMDQNINWNGRRVAPSADNEDKEIRTHFLTLGGQYMFTDQWGVMASVPYWQRTFKTQDDDGDEQSYHHGSLGDIRLKAIYSGFFSDRSTGVTFGVKLPTGDYSSTGFDRDTAIGTGSTDLLAGVYHMGWVDTAHSLGWLANAELDHPVMTTAGYRPGDEIDATAALYYEKWTVGPVAVTPIAQVIGTYRLRDRGPAADPDGSGYQRVLLSPGIEFSEGKNRLFASVAVPVYEDVRGDQLTAPVLFKVQLNRDF